MNYHLEPILLQIEIHYLLNYIFFPPSAINFVQLDINVTSDNTTVEGGIKWD